MLYLFRQIIVFVFCFSLLSFTGCASAHPVNEDGSKTVKNANSDGDKDFISANKYVNPLAVIVIDAGHGGADRGASGKRTSEKVITLGIARRIASYLKKRLPNSKILLTRDGDITQSVKAKAAYANQVNADLFVSIHCNSTPAQTGTSVANMPSGTESYIWNINKNTQKRLAIEAQDKKNGKYKDSRLLYDMKAKKCFKQSAMLAKQFETEFAKVGRSSRMARQRHEGIWVLQATAMPSVLIETGFISNPKDENYLMSVSGQNQMAECVATAIVKYYKRLGGR